MVSLLIAFVVSLFVSGLIIRLSRTRALAWADDHAQGVQKFHAGTVPRVGGLAIAVALREPGSVGRLVAIGPGG